MRDDDLLRLSRRQFGVFSHAQAAGTGLHRSTIVRRVHRGRYQRLHPGVFRDRAVADSWEARAMAALLAVGGDAMLARATAARIHGLELPRQPGSTVIHLLDRARTFDLPGVVVHRSRTIDPVDATRVGPFAVTSATRTILDLAADVDGPSLRRVVAQAVRTHATDATKLREAARRLGRVAGKGIVLALADELSPLDADCRSALETDFLRLARRANLVPTAMNHAVTDDRGRRRVLDAVYLPERLPVELDSRAWHGSLLDWHDDLRRENGLVLAGWRPPLRFSAADLRDHPGEVIASIRAGLVAPDRS